MPVRKYLYLALVAAPAVALAAPLATAQAATVHVLTTGKAGGTAVAKGDVLKASLASGKNAVFTIKVGTTTATLTCKSSSFSAKVTNNPAKPGTATESLTAESFAKCTANIPGVTVKSIVVNNLPYNATVSDSTGDPVKVSGTSTSKPIEITGVIALGPSTVTCSFGAPSVSGSASNTGNTVSFSNQTLKHLGGAGCPTTSPATFSATYGPVVDSTASGSPKVFVN